MNKDRDILKELFQDLPEGSPSSDFRNIMMQKIQHEAQKQKSVNELWSWIILIFTSLFLIGIGIGAIIYLGVPKITFRIPDMTGIGLYCMVGIAAFLLLILDNRLRKHYQKKQLNYRERSNT